MPSMRERWVAAGWGWTHGWVPSASRPKSQAMRRRGGAMTPAIQLGRRGRQRREVSAGKRPAANKADWRTTATAVGGIVSVLLVAVGLFYTNNANREQQRLGLDQQKLA